MHEVLEFRQILNKNVSPAIWNYPGFTVATCQYLHEYKSPENPVQSES